MTDVVWGVDVSCKRVAFADTEGRTASIEIPKHLAGAERLSVARDAVRLYCAGHAQVAPPLCVWVERPTGKYPSPSLVQMEGVVCEAIYSALKTLFPFPVSVHPIAVSQWKKAVLGNGNASKADVWRWAAFRRGPGPLTVNPALNQDEADALAIAFAGRSLLGEEQAA